MIINNIYMIKTKLDPEVTHTTEYSPVPAVSPNNEIIVLTFRDKSDHVMIIIYDDIRILLSKIVGCLLIFMSKTHPQIEKVRLEDKENEIARAI